MTTIAFDGKTLAVDSQSTIGWISSRECQKMFFDVGDYLCVALCGELHVFPPIMQWLANGADPEESGWAQWDAAAWVVTTDGIVQRFVGPYPETVSTPDADGSGAQFALGAMAAGVSAMEAMIIACDYDLYSDGHIHLFEIPAAKLSLVQNEAS